MNCIFCKKSTSEYSSIEHIIPESLGNSAHVLPRGSICNRCNNYFGIRIEKPILESGIFTNLRAFMRVPNKRGRIPQSLAQCVTELPDFRLMSRFVGKIGLEALCHQVKEVKSWNSEIVNCVSLDELRQFVRNNIGPDWPMAYRTLYPSNSMFRDNSETYEVLHEWDILMTEKQEYYAVVVLFGVEFALNLGGRTLQGYHEWIRKNDGRSFLYIDQSEAKGLYTIEMLDKTGR